MKKITFLIFSLLVMNIFLNAQNKYNSSINGDCDPVVLPSPDTYKLEWDTTQMENRIKNDFISLPCNVLYEIKLKQKDNEIVTWKVMNAIITIYPKNKKINYYENKNK